MALSHHAGPSPGEMIGEGVLWPAPGIWAAVGEVVSAEPCYRKGAATCGGARNDADRPATGCIGERRRPEDSGPRDAAAMVRRCRLGPGVFVHQDATGCIRRHP